MSARERLVIGDRARRTRGAPSRSCQSAGSSSTSSARGSAGTASRAASSASSENDDSSGGTSASRQSAVGIERDRRAGLALASGRRLDLDVARDAMRARPAGDRGERRQRLAGVLRRVPAAGVEARQLAPRQRVGAAAAARRALERRVVQQERHVVGGELHVELDHPIAVRVPDAHRGQRVLGRELAGAAMGDEPRIRPVLRDVGRHVSGSSRRSRVEQVHARRIGGEMQRRADLRMRRRAAAAPSADPCRATRCTSVSAPSCSTISTVAAKSAAAALAGSRCSGRMPTVTARPASAVPLACRTAAAVVERDPAAAFGAAGEEIHRRRADEAGDERAWPGSRRPPSACRSARRGRRSSRSCAARASSPRPGRA